MNNEKVIASGYIKRNFLDDFPGNVYLTKDNNYYIKIQTNAFICNINVPANTVIDLTESLYNHRNIKVNWGDTEYENISLDLEHTYINPGTYKLSIYGSFDSFKIVVPNYNTNDFRLYLTDILSWGLNDYKHFIKAFSNCTNLKHIPDDALPNVTNAAYMFENCNIESLGLNFKLPDNLLTGTGMFLSGLCSSFITKNIDDFLTDGYNPGCKHPLYPNKMLVDIDYMFLGNNVSGDINWFADNYYKNTYRIYDKYENISAIIDSTSAFIPEENIIKKLP